MHKTIRKHIKVYLKSTHSGFLELAYTGSHKTIVKMFRNFASHCQLEIGQLGSIYTTEIGKHDKSGLFFLSEKPVHQHTND